MANSEFESTMLKAIRLDTSFCLYSPTKWNVHTKQAFGGPEQMLKYLARYNHKIAISNYWNVLVAKKVR